MLNSLYALILTDSLHLPTTIGYFNTRPAACQARQSAHAWLKGESQSVESLNCFSNAAVNILDQCRTAIEKNPAHYVDLRVKPVDDLSDPETTPFRVYYETAAGDRYFTVMETVTDLSASRIVSHTIPNCTVIVTAFPDEHVETVGYTEVKPEMLDALALHQPKPTAPFNLQSELSRLELNGACSYDGKLLILLEQAYCSYDCYHGIAQYVATAICPNEIAKDFTAPCYVVTWPIIHPSAENEEDACDWSAPNGLTPNGEYDLKRRYHY